MRGDRGRGRWAAVGIALVAAAVTGAGPARASVPTCAAGVGFVSQAPDGRISACVRIGDVAPGLHQVTLQELVPQTTVVARKGGRTFGPPVEPAVMLRVVPAAGRPGQVVTVIGTLRRPHHGETHPNLCWDGCADGLGYGDPPLHWTSPRTFRVRLIIPAAPWIASKVGRVVMPTDGPHEIAIECLRIAAGCSGIAEGSVAFTVHGARRPAWCRRVRSCAPLTVTPGRAAPGTVVRVRGYVPLTSGPGAGGGQLLTPAVVRFERRRPALSLATRFGVITLSAGAARLRVTVPPAYGRYAAPPIAETTDGLAPIAADPADPSVVASCDGSAVAMTTPAGASTIPTAAAVPVLRQLGFTPIGGVSGAPSCVAVAPIDSTAGTETGVAVAFSVAWGTDSPPFYDAALATYDGGQSWAPVPAPATSAPAGFGGFRYVGAAVEAVFAPKAPGRAGAPPQFNPAAAVAEIADGDGRHWHDAPLACPAAGPCVSFGPYLPDNCAMNGALQFVLRAAGAPIPDRAAGFPGMVNGCGEAEVVAPTPDSALLVDTAGTFPVLRTTTGGRSWRVVGLPATPRGVGPVTGRGGPGGITVLPDGGLLLTGETPGESPRPWALLTPGAQAWCRVRSVAPALQRAMQVSSITPIGTELWWLTETGHPASPGPPALNRISASALAC